VNELQGPLAPGELEEVVSSKHPGADISITHNRHTPSIRLRFTKRLMLLPETPCISFQRFMDTLHGVS